MNLPQATGSHVTSDAGGREDMLDAIWWVSVSAAVSVSLVAASVVF